jgi:signal transduction histidine kinase
MKAPQLLKNNLDFQIIFLAVLFFSSACLAYSLRFDELNTLPAWPPTGIGLACIILLGRQAWPGITIGSLLANLLAYWNDASLPLSTIIITSASIAAIQTAEILLGNYLVKKWIENIYPFTAAKNTFRFLTIIVGICLVSSAGTTGVLLANGIVSADKVLITALFSGVGDFVGILLFTPAILSCASRFDFRFHRDNVIELVVLFVFLFFASYFLRIEYFQTTFQRALPFLVIPVLLWMAFKYPLLISMASVLIVALVSIFFTVNHAGPFVLQTPDNSILLLQIFIAVMSTCTIVVAATVNEREEAQKQLQHFNETLEMKIAERTSSLNEEIQTRKSTEQKLLQTNQELSKRNTELDNFVYSVSHDLRAPVASVLGLTNLAKRDEGPMKDQYLEMIQKSALQQDHFIREILDQSRNSRLEVKREEISFENLINETFDQLKFATINGHLVTRVVHVKQDKPFFTDRWRLKVMLNNIISNSIRYRNGKDPVIEVNVEVDDQLASVEIQDNGKGISKEHLGNVCQMFYRATDDGPGSGLGLYIVKETIEKLNGSLKIDSELGKGTCVKLQIPEVVLN